MDKLVNSKLITADMIMIIGMRVSMGSLELYDALKEVSQKESSKVVYAHPIEDVAMQNIAKQFMKYEPGSEEGVLALLAYHLLKSVTLPEDKKFFLDDLDLAYLEAESSTGEEEYEEIIRSFEQASHPLLIVGDDVMTHDRAENIAKICALIQEYSSIPVMLAPSYKLEMSEKIGLNPKLEEVEELPEYNGTVIYNSTSTQDSENSLYGSAQFATAARISDGDFISISFGGQTLNKTFKMDSELKGTIAINPTLDMDVESTRYKFERSKISKINQKSENR